MKRKLTAQSAFLRRRVLFSLLVCIPAAASMVSGTLLAFFHPEAPSNASQRTLTFAERVAYQRAIEEVYWRHRIWPKQRPDPKPSLDAVISQPPCSNWIVRVDRLLGEHGLERALLRSWNWNREVSPSALLPFCKSEWNSFTGGGITALDSGQRIAKRIHL